MLFEFLLVPPVMLGFWWVIRRDMNLWRDMNERQRRLDAARAARSGDHD